GGGGGGGEGGEGGGGGGGGRGGARNRRAAEVQRHEDRDGERTPEVRPHGTDRVKAIDAVLFTPVGVVVDDRGEPYPDAVPALAELEALGVKVIEVVSITAAALAAAVAAASPSPDRGICLTDTEDGMRAAGDAGIAPTLMMNAPDEAMRLTAFKPAGGIVSLVELPDFVRLLLARGVAREP